jgi:hypothetical protein
MDEPAAARCLDGLVTKHPYLYLDADGIGQLKARIAASEELGAMSAALRERADEMLETVPEPPVRDARNTILRASRRVLGRVLTLGLTHLLTGESRYVRRAADEMLSAADYEDWDPGHFLDTAEMSCAMGIGYDWLNDALSPGERGEIRNAIVHKGLEPFLDGGWWAMIDHNWNQVCNGGCVVGALAIAHDRPAIARRVISRAVSDVPLALESYGRDGGWAEGPMYWGYATKYTVLMLAALQTALGHDFGLGEIAGLRNAGDFWIHTTGPGSQSFNFADATHRAGGQPSMFWLAKRFERPEWAAFERPRTRPDDALALLWYMLPDEMPEAPQLPTCTLFRDTHVACLRTGWDADAVFVGFKGGDNRANHGHLDLGSFVLDAAGVRWACDLGGERYSVPDYFGALRWDYFRTRTESHNVFTFGSRNQDPAAAAPMTDYDAGEGCGFAVCDLTAAYAASARSARRGVALLPGGDVLVCDEVMPVRGEGELRWGFTTEACAQADGGLLALTQDGRDLSAVVLEPYGAVFDVKPATRPEPESVNEGVSRVTVAVPLAEGPGPLRIAVLFRTGGSQAAPAAAPPLDAWRGSILGNGWQVQPGG